MASKGFRVAENVLTFIAGNVRAADSEEPAGPPEEEPRAALLRHILDLPRRGDGSVWVAGLTADELDLLADEANLLVKAVNDTSAKTPTSRGQLLAARAVMRACGSLRDEAPTVSIIGAPEPEPEPIEVDPLVEQIQEAEKTYAETLADHKAAARKRRDLLRERNAKIVATAKANPRLTNDQLGERFGLDGTQVSRIVTAQSERKD
ncbi:hypothetical protein [Amycolatopsis kentuckyensis]|uniref:hypothetical protein n=1 Tax=Amycolatopsis kentuckyensis TaxID=218823 RepID=UPI003568B3E9